MKFDLLNKIIRFCGRLKFFDNLGSGYSKKKKDNGVCCVMGSHGMLHPEAEIINLQNNTDAITIGNFTHIRGRLFVYPSGGKISIGNYCYFGENSNIWSAVNVVVEDNVLIAHDVDIFDHNMHPTNALERHEHYKQIILEGHSKEKINWDEKPIYIKKNAWIGCKSIIIKGITIGEGAIVAAGSVVTKNVEPFTMVAGNPARVIKKIDHDENI